MAKLRVRPHSWATGYDFYCPGCDIDHVVEVRTDGQQPSWSFDGDLDRPTILPSILVHWGAANVCHSFVRDGRIEFLPDCTHPLAGQTVDMVDIPPLFSPRLLRE